MAESILSRILNDEISIEYLLKWLSGQNQQFNQNGNFSNFQCSTGDFTSHFLNYIHEEAPSFDVEHTNKVTFTPKSIKNKVDKNKIDYKNVKKRPPLFTDIKNDVKIIQSHTFPVTTTKTYESENKHNFNGDKIYGSSTPKLMKIHSDGVLNGSYASPISPLYSRDCFNTPKNRSGEKTLCLGDFIVTKKSSSKKKVQRSLTHISPLNDKFEGRLPKGKPEVSDVSPFRASENKKLRRINPTNLNQKKFSVGFKGSDNSFNFNDKFVELTVDSQDEQRNLLAEERLKIKNNFDDLVKSPNIIKLQSFPNNKTEINASIEKVTFVNQLEKLIKVYIFFLNNNRVLNISSEIHFLISLLLSKQYICENLNDSDSDIQLLDVIVKRKDVFKSVHNCVYFAVNALKSQKSILKTLDRATLKLLYENERMKMFSQYLYFNLITIYNSKLEQLKENNEIVQNNVCFISDTDNRENFPTDTSFHAFRKQRDLFYEILRIWEQNHFVPEWSFGIALSGKIWTLLNLCNDPVNYRHFARLFKMQLLTTCRQNNDESVAEQQTSILSTFPNIDADKLNRLKTRLVTKQDNYENLTPTFTGDEEFYKEFILASSLNVFHQHLKDSLVLEIVQLTENFEAFLENDENHHVIDATTRNSFFTSLKCLRVLAKFLGFLESLPYKSEIRTNWDKVVKSEIDTRKWYQPNFDLKLILLNSLKYKTLILTIPCVCRYLSMLDYTTLRLSYFEQILEILFCIYYSTSASQNDEDSPVLNYNTMLVRLSLGWLFELPHFPSEFYFNWISKSSNIDIPKLHLTLNNLTLTQSENFDQRGPYLDDLEMVDQTILYSFCPYLEGFRKILANNSTNTGNVIKHITPLSSVEASSDITDKKLKCQLEEAFFNGQPISVRKTVEFVSERVASSCVKHICNQIVPEFKKSAIEEAKLLYQQIKNKHKDGQKLLETLLKNKCTELSPQYLKKLQLICAKETEKLTNERIPSSIEMLLTVDELQQTRETCSEIAKRLCVDRIQQWQNSHVNIGLFTKILTAEAQRIMALSDKDVKEKPMFILPSGGKDIEHNDNTLNAVKLIENIRKFNIDLLEHNPISSDFIKDLLKVIEASILGRSDFNDHILSLVNRTLVDFALLLLAHKIEFFDEALPLLIEHWKKFLKSQDDQFNSLISPRNVMLLAQSENITKSWSSLSKFIVSLLENELLCCKAFEMQCISIYKIEWDEVTLKHLSTCLQHVLDYFKNIGTKFNQFTPLVDFMSSSCSYMEF